MRRSAVTDRNAEAREWRGGFTVTELLVVIGIMVLVITLAAPLLSVLSGSRSIEGAQNQIAALLNSARTEAMSMQRITGVMFFRDPATERTYGVTVYNTTEPPLLGMGASSADIWLDVVPERDFVSLPAGVALQAINDDQRDRYLGFNVYGGPGAPNTGNDPTTVEVGGVFLFDKTGQLLSRPYGFRNGYGLLKNSRRSSAMARLLYRLPAADGSIRYNGDPVSDPAYRDPFPPGNPAVDFVPRIAGDSGEAGFSVRSQIGLVLFDGERFKSRGFNQGDPSFGANAEDPEHKWIDENSIPLLVNRYNGTLIKGE